MSKHIFNFEEKKEILFLTLRQKNEKIEFEINCQSTFPSPYYAKEFSLNDFQKLSKYFHIFDSIDECFADFKEKFECNNYEINLNEIKEKISIKIKTNIAKKDFDIDIPIKKLELEKTYSKFIYHTPIRHINDSAEKNYFEKFEQYYEEKLKNLENIINFKMKEYTNDIIFEKSTIIQNNFERKLLESFIKENDKTKKDIYPVLLYKATVDGDDCKEFHKKCDFMGATITIVKSETGRRFGGYTSVSWDKSLANYCDKGINFLFSLDTRKYYKNTSGSYQTYHDSDRGPCFGSSHDLYICTGCLNNQSSHTIKSCFEMTSSYELNGGIKNFKVLDYEVFQI